MHLSGTSRHLATGALPSARGKRMGGPLARLTAPLPHLSKNDVAEIDAEIGRALGEMGGAEFANDRR